MALLHTKHSVGLTYLPTTFTSFRFRLFYYWHWALGGSVVLVPKQHKYNIRNYFSLKLSISIAKLTNVWHFIISTLFWGVPTFCYDIMWSLLIIRICHVPGLTFLKYIYSAYFASKGIENKYLTGVKKMLDTNCCFLLFLVERSVAMEI